MITFLNYKYEYKSYKLFILNIVKSEAIQNAVYLALRWYITYEYCFKHLYLFRIILRNSIKNLNSIKIVWCVIFLFFNTVPMRCTMHCVTKPVSVVFKNKIKLFVTNTNYFSSDYELLS